MNGRSLSLSLALMSLLWLQTALWAAPSAGVTAQSKLAHKWQGEVPGGRTWQTQRDSDKTSGNNRLPSSGSETASVPPSSSTVLTPPPRPSVDLTRGVLLDFSAEDDKWPELRQFVQGVCQDLGLTVKTLVYKKDTATLVQALAERPALVIVGSCREFSLDEAALLAEYVQEGGVLVAVPQGTTQGVARATQLNRLLSELGVSVTYGRPAGPVKVLSHPATEGLPANLKAGAGCSVWAYTLWPLAGVGQFVMVSQHQFGAGQILVFDGNTLRPTANLKPNTADPNVPFRAFFVSCLKWLAGK